MSRWVSVGPERLAGWIDRFAAAHGGVVESTVDPDAVRLTAADGTVAQLVVPFGQIGKAFDRHDGQVECPLRQIEVVDPEFSSVLFQDFVFRLYSTAHHYRGLDGKLDELSPYLSASARRSLAERQPVQQPVTEVVIGKMNIVRVSVPTPEDGGDFAAFVKVGVQFEANYSVGSGPGSRR